MKIALVMEWSTCTKNEIVYETLKKKRFSLTNSLHNLGLLLDSLIWMTIVRHTTRMPF